MEPQFSPDQLSERIAANLEYLADLALTGPRLASASVLLLPFDQSGRQR
jgi:hypothetical protein